MCSGQALAILAGFLSQIQQNGEYLYLSLINLVHERILIETYGTGIITISYVNKLVHNKNL